MISDNKATIWLTTLVLLSTVTGCATRTAHSAAAAPVSVETWVMGNGPWQDFYSRLAARFNAEHPGTRVNVHFIPWEQAHSKLVLAAYAGSGPDVATDGGRWTAELAAMGALEPLDAYLRAADRRDFLDVAWQSTQWHGQTWGLPQSFTTSALFYRTDWLQQAGYDHPPQTWAEMRDVAKKETTHGHFGFGLVGDPSMETTMYWTPFLWQNGGELLTADGKKAAFNSPVGVEALQFYVKLYRADHVVPAGCLALKRSDVQMEFRNGVVGMTIGGPSFWRDMQRDKLAFPWAIAPAPSGTTAANLATTDHIVMLKTAKHKQAAWAWIDYVTNPQHANEWNRCIGFIPARKSSLRDPAWQSDRQQAVLVAAAKQARSYPTLPEWPQIDDQIAQAVHAALAGQKTPKEALDDAAIAVNDILAQAH